MSLRVVLGWFACVIRALLEGNSFEVKRFGPSHLKLGGHRRWQCSWVLPGAAPVLGGCYNSDGQVRMDILKSGCFQIQGLQFLKNPHNLHQRYHLTPSCPSKQQAGAKGHGEVTRVSEHHITLASAVLRRCICASHIHGVIISPPKHNTATWLSDRDLVAMRQQK